MEIKYRCQSLSRVRIPFSPPFKSADKALFLWRAGGERGEEALIRRGRSALVTDSPVRIIVLWKCKAVRQIYDMNENNI